MNSAIVQIALYSLTAISGIVSVIYLLFRKNLTAEMDLLKKEMEAKDQIDKNTCNNEHAKVQLQLKDIQKDIEIINLKIRK